MAMNAMQMMPLAYSFQTLVISMILKIVPSPKRRSYVKTVKVMHMLFQVRSLY